MNDKLENMPECLERTTIYESDYVCLYTDKVRLPSGGIIENIIKYIILRNRWQQLFLMKIKIFCLFITADTQQDTQNGKFRLGVIGTGEKAEIAAAREAMEETGCELKRIKYLCSQNPSNGMSDAVVHGSFD